MFSPTSLLRDTLFTLRYVPLPQLAALAKHRLGSLRRRLLGNPWLARIGRLAEREWPTVRTRPLALPPLRSELSREDLLSRWRLFQSGKLVLLNREEVFTPGSLWEHVDDPLLPPLAAETFHYHQFLAGFGELLHHPEADMVDRAEILASLTLLLETWSTRYPVGKQPAWGSFAAAFRVRSWLYLHRALAMCQEPQARSIQEVIERAVLTHGLFLERNLEHHLGGNHLFKDLCAMAMLASLFEGPSANRWFALVERNLKHELQIQILPDGGHYERSPMYQCLVLTDLLDAAEYLMGWNPSWVTDNLVGPIERMAKLLSGILHPNGEIPLFNDSVLGQSAPARAILRRAEELLGKSMHEGKDSLATFPDTGLTCIHHGDLTCIIDHGRLGPDELMGHVHNDTLSFELSVGDERFIVDKGVYEYTAGPRRTESRSVRSHNTPSVEGFEQAETWASFRVARRWHIRSATVSEDPTGISVQGEWTRPGMEWISRKVTAVSGDLLMIRDEIRCGSLRICQIPLHFAPGIAVEVRPEQGDGLCWRWEASSGSHILFGRIHSSGPANVTVEEATYWPRFYTELASSRIVIGAEVQASLVVITYLATRWEALRNLPTRA